MAEINNFIRTIMEEDLASGRHDHIATRFPPEPNAFMHIGHARAIITNFELAKLFGGTTNLRFDDTNPEKEDDRFVQAIIEDVKWLGYEPTQILYGSDYFDIQYEYALKLINKGLAYVCELSAEQISEYRGTLTTPGKNSPYRERSIEENLRLFQEMRDGKHPEGSMTLRAKIDMAHDNLNMRDPVIYRISFDHHHRQKNKWCIYPMYDFAHPLQDATEGITHSLCSLEFENHRILYDWVVDNCETPHKPRQIEFGRLNITHTITSKRYVVQLVEAGLVNGYDDPRLATLRGLRRRGVRPSAIREFILSTGLSRVNATVDGEMFEHFIREDLKLSSERIMAVTDPLKVTITNYPEDKVEYFEVPANQENPELGTRKISFSKHLYIEKADFLLEKPNKHYKRLALGIEVRLMNAYFIKANKVKYDDAGNIVEVLCTYDPETLSGTGFNARKPNGTIGYVDAKTAVPAVFNKYYDLLLDEEFNRENFLERLNPESWDQTHGFVSMGDYQLEDHYQFIRDGYYYVEGTSPLTFNRTVALKSTFKKE